MKLDPFAGDIVAITQSVWDLITTHYSANNSQQIFSNSISPFIRSSSFNQDLIHQHQHSHSHDIIKSKQYKGRNQNMPQLKLMQKDSNEIIVTNNIQQDQIIFEVKCEMALQQCEQCKQIKLNEDKIKLRKDYEHNFAKKCDSNLNKQADFWYMLDQKWINRWKKFIQTDSSTLPGPITNNKLLESDNVTPVPELTHRDYRGVNKEMWDFLFQIYGGGPEIKRRTLDIYED